VKKARKAEASAKRHREAEKAGLPEPESSEASVSEIEGRVDSHWLNELLEEEEDEEAPSSGGGQRPLGGQRPQGCLGFLGAQREPPTSLLTRAGTKPLRGVRFPQVPKEGRSHWVESQKRPWA